MELMERILSDENVAMALEYMERNKKDTAPGIDGMMVSELREYLSANWRELKPALLTSSPPVR